MNYPVEILVAGAGYDGNPFVTPVRAWSEHLADVQPPAHWAFSILYTQQFASTEEMNRVLEAGQKLRPSDLVALHWNTLGRLMSAMKLGEIARPRVILVVREANEMQARMLKDAIKRSRYAAAIEQWQHDHVGDE